MTNNKPYVWNPGITPERRAEVRTAMEAQGFPILAPAGEVCPYDVGPGCPCNPCACHLRREGKTPAPHPNAR